MPGRGLRLSRRAPQIIILLDILTLWVFALLSLPTGETGVTYQPINQKAGLMDAYWVIQGSPDEPDKVWFSQGGNLRERPLLTAFKMPRGIPGIQCPDTSGECFGVLPDQSALTFYPPAAVASALERLYFTACVANAEKSCGNKVLLDVSTGVSRICGADGFVWQSLPTESEPTRTQYACKLR